MLNPEELNTSYTYMVKLWWDLSSIMGHGVRCAIPHFCIFVTYTQHLLQNLEPESALDASCWFEVDRRELLCRNLWQSLRQMGPSESGSFSLEDFKRLELRAELFFKESSAFRLVRPSCLHSAWPWSWTPSEGAQRRTNRSCNREGKSLLTKHRRDTTSTSSLWCRTVFDFDSVKWDRRNKIDRACRLQNVEDIIDLVEKKVSKHGILVSKFIL